MKEIKYGLQNKKTLKLATYSVNDFCGSLSYKISDNAEDPKWAVNTKEEAEFARNQSTQWYNSTMETPEHNSNFTPEDYQVVEIETTVKIKTVDIKLPNYEDFTRIRLSEAKSESDKTHFENLLKEYAEDKEKLSKKQLDQRYTLFLHEIKSYCK